MNWMGWRRTEKKQLKFCKKFLHRKKSLTFEKLDFWKFFNHYRKTTTTNRGLEKVNFMTLSGEIREKNQDSVKKKTKMKCKSAHKVFSIILCVCLPKSRKKTRKTDSPNAPLNMKLNQVEQVKIDLIFFL